MSPIATRVGSRDMMLYRSKADEELGYIKENLQRLSVEIPNVTTDDLPRRYQCHTAGVSG